MVPAIQEWWATLQECVAAAPAIQEWAATLEWMDSQTRPAHKELKTIEKQPTH